MYLKYKNMFGNLKYIYKAKYNILKTILIKIEKYNLF